MAIASAAGRASAAPTTLRGPSVYATTGVTPRVLEVGIFNTTVTACSVALVRATTNGTPGTALTRVGETDTAQTPVTLAYNTHGADQTVGSPVRQASLGAAIGAGVIWTFTDQGLLLPAVASNGLVIICPVGTGQIVDFYFVWRE